MQAYRDYFTFFLYFGLNSCDSVALFCELFWVVFSVVGVLFLADLSPIRVFVAD